MKITHSFLKNKCDIGGCANTAEYIVSDGEDNKRHDLHFCAKCLKEIYLELAKLYTPKSPKNKLNKNFNTEILEIYKNGEK